MSGRIGQNETTGVPGARGRAANLAFLGASLTLFFAYGLVVVIGPVTGAIGVLDFYPIEAAALSAPALASALVTLFVVRFRARANGSQVCCTPATGAVQAACGIALPALLAAGVAFPAYAGLLAGAGFAASGVALALGAVCWFKVLESSVVEHLARLTEGALVCGIALFALAGLAPSGGLTVAVVAFFAVAQGAVMVAACRRRWESEWASREDERIEKYPIRNLVNEGAQGFVYGAFLVFVACVGMPWDIAVAALSAGIAGALVWEIVIYRFAVSPLNIQRVLQAVLVSGFAGALAICATVSLSAGIAVASFVALAAFVHFCITEFNNMLIKVREYNFKPIAYFTKHVCLLAVAVALGVGAAATVVALAPSAERAIVSVIPALIALMAVTSIVYIDTKKDFLVKETAKPEADERGGSEPGSVTEHSEVSFDDLDAAGRSIAEEHALSKRETEVLLLLIRGRNTRTIQEKLGISSSTVKTHTYRIYKKVGVGNRQELLDRLEHLIEQGSSSKS